jgi:hypothetical protein
VLLDHREHAEAAQRVERRQAPRGWLTGDAHRDATSRRCDRRSGT